MEITWGEVFDLVDNPDGSTSVFKKEGVPMWLAQKILEL